MAAIIGGLSVENDFLRNAEDDDLEGIATSPAIQSFFNIDKHNRIFVKKNVSL